MSIGIVVEYNPFHNGHLKQINFIKENFPEEEIVIVMSDKYTQRGEINVLPFEKRVEIAKKFGINKILKLSFEETVQAAHIFAQNAIKKLNEYGIDRLVFGSETNDSETMIECAKILVENETKFYALTRKIMKLEKISFPKASNLALQELSSKNYTMPNDILGLEYVKTIIKNNLKIEIITIKRNIPFHSTEPLEKYASASLIRNLIKNNKDVSQYMPIKIDINSVDYVQNHYNEFQKIMKSIDIEKLQKIPVISEGIENLLLKNINAKTYEDFVNKCTSKRYTSSRIKRIISWVLEKKF
ncbi:nucleotidyltransferase [Mycoplasma sp. Mirounga ES2805-ORL]|uniref:nucleotidyltransferase n=1 Tax=Mycoplasma sp. Mirounga ES2805-ORL TaxID=754514 RepID=UPI00197C89D7|nr:nucleotidyltransferase [Mycoplasma sp. Mirounga ES2805-ORL]QSF13863.1 nucleotidyltransferase [Mycoplasma sp. Mirounga ES2805-ORL]